MRMLVVISGNISITANIRMMVYNLQSTLTYILLIGTDPMR